MRAEWRAGGRAADGDGTGRRSGRRAGERPAPAGWEGVGWLGVSTSTAHWAHIGGFVSGVAMVFLATMLYKPAPKPDPFECLDD